MKSVVGSQKSMALESPPGRGRVGLVRVKPEVRRRRRRNPITTVQSVDWDAKKRSTPEWVE